MTTNGWHSGDDAGELHSGDDALLAELREALSSPGPVPERMRTAARAAFAWRGLDEELELLVLAHDSALEHDSQVRDDLATAPRTLSFQGAELSVEIEIGSDLMGQLIPPQPGHITLVTGQGSGAEADADDVGCFRLPLPGRGPARLTCRTAGGTSATEWTTL